MVIFLILVGLQRCGNNLVLSFLQNKANQNKILKFRIISSLPSPCLPSPVLQGKHVWSDQLNSNFICMQRSHPVLQLFQKMLIICFVSSRVGLCYSFKFTFNIRSLSVWQDLRPYHFLLSVHYSILMNTFVKPTAIVCNLCEASVFLCPLQVSKRLQYVKASL